MLVWGWFCLGWCNLKDINMKTDELENKAVVELYKLCKKHGLKPVNLALHLNVVPIRIYEILHGKRNITADTDLRLTTFFELKEGHFLKMQADYDLALTRRKIDDKLRRIVSVSDIVKKG